MTVVILTLVSTLDVVVSACKFELLNWIQPAASSLDAKKSVSSKTSVNVVVKLPQLAVSW